MCVSVSKNWILENGKNLTKLLINKNYLNKHSVLYFGFLFALVLLFLFLLYFLLILFFHFDYEKIFHRERFINLSRYFCTFTFNYSCSWSEVVLFLSAVGVLMPIKLWWLRLHSSSVNVQMKILLHFSRCSTTASTFVRLNKSVGA